VALKAFADGLFFADVIGTDRPRVLALHGWGRSHADFKTVLAGFDAVSVDFPGFGASPQPVTGWGSADYANAVRPAWELFDEPPVVVGHSFGGRVAVHLAQGMPMRALVLIGVPLIRPPSNRKAAPAFRMMRRLHRLGLVSDQRIETVRQRYGSVEYRATSGVMREVFVRVVNESYEEQLDRLTVPVKMLWGSLDTAAPLDLATQAYERLLSNGADVQMQVLEGVGHHVMAEQPEMVRSLIAEVLE
jgi:pimeloyl-ACP methyl ester carboxylesterase